MKNALAKMIMDTKTKAECARSAGEYEELIDLYKYLRKRWEEVAGNAVIGIEIPQAKVRL